MAGVTPPQIYVQRYGTKRPTCIIWLYGKKYDPAEIWILQQAQQLHANNRGALLYTYFLNINILRIFHTLRYLQISNFDNVRSVSSRRSDFYDLIAFRGGTTVSDIGPWTL